MRLGSNQNFNCRIILILISYILVDLVRPIGFFKTKTLQYKINNYRDNIVQVKMTK